MGLSVNYERVLVKKEGVGLNGRFGLPMINLLSSDNFGAPVHPNGIIGVVAYYGRGIWKPETALNWQILGDRWDNQDRLQFGQSFHFTAGVRRQSAGPGFFFGFNAGMGIYQNFSDVQSQVIPTIGIALGSTIGGDPVEKPRREKKYRDGFIRYGFLASGGLTHLRHTPDGNYGGQGGGTGYDLNLPLASRLGVGGVADINIGNRIVRLSAGYEWSKGKYSYDRYSWSLQNPDTTFHYSGTAKWQNHFLIIHPEIGLSWGKVVNTLVGFKSAISLAKTGTLTEQNDAGFVSLTSQNSAWTPGSSFGPTLCISPFLRPNKKRFRYEPFVQAGFSVNKLSGQPAFRSFDVTAGLIFWAYWYGPEPQFR